MPTTRLAIAASVLLLAVACDGGPAWVSQARGGTASGPGPSGALDERYIRNQFAAWLGYMAAA